jgi:tetratricopeptide (TPR) repeat protein
LQKSAEKLFFAIALAATLFVGTRAHADPPAQENERAVAFYESGVKHYNLAEYTEAIEDFKQAYLLNSAPELLFNIAQAYRLKGPGNCRLATQFYRNYLRADPKSRKRASVEDAITDLESCTRAEPLPPPTPEPPPAAPSLPPNAVAKPEPSQEERTTPPPRSVLPPVLVAAGGAVAATGGVLFVWSKLRYSAIQSSGCAPACDPARTEAPKAAELIGGILFGVGAATILSGIAVWTFGSTNGKRAAWIAPAGRGVAAGLRF